MSPKGFSYIVEAMNNLSKNRDLSKRSLVIAFGEGGFIREEKIRIQKSGLSEYFRFLPYTSNVAGSIKSLDVVVMPSLWEACGLLAMEVLVSGIPLIVTNCIGLREVTLDTPAYIVSTKNSTELSEGIRSFIVNDRKEVFKSFTKEAILRFDAKNQAYELKELIHTIVVN
jgi:glycosyltransferase involved in cell wall biosynthesis